MIEAFSYPFMWWALAACLVLAGIHAYLGFHVVKRGVIFVDLSMAQIAAFGMAVAIATNMHDHPVAGYLFPVAATLLGAVIFAWLRHLEHKVPLEAFIGITFASAQALVLLLLEHTASGTEHLKETLVGNIFTVSPSTVIRTAAIYAGIGLIHFLIRKPLFEITNNPEAAKKTRNMFGWDVLFYGTFGIVVTSSVKIAGVLLVFALLVIPSVAGVLVSDKASVRLIVGWSFAFVCSVLGLAAAFLFDAPAAPMILTVLTAALIVHGLAVTAIGKLRTR
ncbi:MAG: metal ABC transporter permease [Calditrichaeota bacterium]|nr:metal ABC transporter permease [Calditrichota bacterium]MCB9368554.1 metal ABC transporter permease [Calditrichota bacterium]